MKFKLFIYLILVFCLFQYLPVSHAQKVSGKGKADSARAAQKEYQDSVKEARQQVMDSTHTAQKQVMDAQKAAREHGLDSMKAARDRNMDSTKNVREHTLDSVKTVRKHFSDSLGAIRKYHDSKHYKDSVTRSRTQKANTLKSKRQASLDSMKAIRQHTLDSVLAKRKITLDSVKTKQKHRTDSLGLVKKYRDSRRFRDSVSIVKHDRADSIKASRDAINKKLTDQRKKHQDSVRARQKFVMDSSTHVRKAHLDSVKTAQKKRADSLAKAKAEKDKAAAAKEKAKSQKLQLALDLKIKQKREKWSNQSMLKKKWSPPRKEIQNTFSRYNYYFNATRKMDEALANMQRGRKENYDSLLGLYPFDPNRDSSLLSADMDSIIHKVSVGIQIHDPRTKWEDDMYLLLGEANYYKGGYNQASTSFRYIISMDEQKKKKDAAKSKKSGNSKPAGKEAPSIVEDDKKTMLDFLKHKAIHNEAILWLARTYTESHQQENAEAVLSLLDADPKLPEELKGQLALEKAFAYLSDNDYKNASAQLSVAAKDSHVPDWLRQRASYLNGQLQQIDGKYALAATSFHEVLGYFPKLDMDFYSRKYEAYNTLLAGNKLDDAVTSLKKLLKDAKYAAYYEQVYFVLGQLAVGIHDNATAINYLQKGIHAPKSTKKQKALSFAALGNVYYNTGNYIAAKRNYDSSAALFKYAPRDSSVGVAVLRSKALGEVTGPATIIHDQDSLLQLATLSDKEQRGEVHRYLRYLQQRRDDSIFKAENANLNNVAAAPVENPEDNNVASWYFANNIGVQQGYNDFKKKWGNRPLTDNWRRSATQTFAGGGGGGGGGANNLSDEANDSLTEAYASLDLDENGFPTEASLLAAIPNTQAKREKSNKLIQRAYIDLGTAYVKELEDYPQALRTLDTLDKRYPDNQQRAQALYLRYLVALRQNRLAEAQPYAAQLINEFPESQYAKLVKPSEDGTNLQQMAASEANFYDETYNLMIQHQYTDVLMRVKEAREKYKDPKYKKRFDIMDGIALAGSGSYNQADTLLREFIKTNPSDSLTAWAEAVIKYINKNKPPAPPSAPPIVPGLGNNVPVNQNLKPANLAPKDSLHVGPNNNNIAANPPGGNNNISPGNTPPGNTPPGNTPPAGNNNGVPAEFTYKPKDEHYCVVSIPGIESRTMGMKAAIADFNTFRFADKNLAVAMDVEGPQTGTVVIKSFPDAATARAYMTALKGTAPIFREYKPNEYHVFIISAANYLKVLADRSVDAYLNFYRQHY